MKRFAREELEQIEKECLSAPQWEGLMVTSGALMYFMPAIELVWVYPVAATHRKGLMRKTYYAIAAVTKDKKEYGLLRENMDQERMERSMIFLNKHLKKQRPYLGMGYSERMAALFKNDFNRMVQMADSGMGIDEETTPPKNICEPRKQEILHP